MRTKRSILSKEYESPPARRLRRLKEPKRSARQTVLDRLNNGDYTLETTPCICGSQDVELVSNHDRDYLPVGIVLCRRCGMMFQSPRLAQDSLATFYNDQYRDMYNPGMRGNAEVYKNSLRTSSPLYTKIVSLVGHVPKSVYDVGMHYGGLLHCFQQAGSRVAGADLDPVGLEFARQELGITAMHGGAAALLQLDSPVELLTYIHVLEHINDLDGEFQTMRRLIQDGGYLFLSVPGALHWPRHKGNDILTTLQLAHSWYFSLPHLAFVAARNGFHLQQGDDNVDALFVKGDPDPDPRIPDEYAHVRQGLTDIHKQWTRQRRLRKLKQLLHI